MGKSLLKSADLFFPTFPSRLSQGNQNPSTCFISSRRRELLQSTNHRTCSRRLLPVLDVSFYSRRTICASCARPSDHLQAPSQLQSHLFSACSRRLLHARCLHPVQRLLPPSSDFTGDKTVNGETKNLTSDDDSLYGKTCSGAWTQDTTSVAHEEQPPHLRKPPDNWEVDGDGNEIICRNEKEKGTIKGKRKNVFLPDDILLDILKRLPDAFLGHRARYVCTRWMDLIRNRILVDRASFILQKPRELTARSSCGYKGRRRRSRATKCNEYCGGYCTLKCGVALSFDVFKGIYKVVHLFPGPPVECHILILRKDIVSSKWKKIQVPYMNGLGGQLLSENPVLVQGRYIHRKVDWSVYHNKGLVSIDMVKEEIVDISLPLPLTGDPMEPNYTIFEMGGSLALFAQVSEDKAEIWSLKDVHRNKWEKLQSVTLEVEMWYYRKLPVCGVISNNKYIIMRSKFYRDMSCYHLKNGAKKKLDIHIHFGEHCVVHSSPPSF
ncbi:hypothetical protein LXL04_000224 [Taraxacum kok-saghyz]